MSKRSLRRVHSRKAVANITLIEGTGLPNGKNKDPRVYCFLKLGNQHEESSTSNDYSNPVWKESFEFDIYNGNSEPLQVFVRHRIPKSLNGENIGEATLDLQHFTPDVMVNICKDVKGVENGKLHLMVTISGISDEGRNENWNILKSFLSKEESISYKNFSSSNVGYLVLCVHKAENIPVTYFGNKPDPFCLIKACGNIFRTRTIFNSTTPIWEKYFVMEFADITSCLQIDVFDECDRNNHHILATLKIPFLQMDKKGKMWYVLTKHGSNTYSPFKPTIEDEEPKILLECLISYNTGMV